MTTIFRQGRSIAALFLFALVATARADVSFQQISFTDACKQAAKQHKSIMIDLYTDWCYWCKVLDQKTYTSADVAQYASEHFIALKVNAEQGEGIAIASKFNVNGYPTIIFLDENASESHRVVGFEPPAKFLNSMRVGGMGSLASMEQHFRDHPEDVQIAFDLAQRYDKTSDPAHAAEFYARVVALDTNNALHLAEKAALPMAYASFSAGNPAALESYLTTYGSNDETPGVHRTLMEYYFQKLDSAAATRHYDALHAASPDDDAVPYAYAWLCSQTGINLDGAMRIADQLLANAADGPHKAQCLNLRAEIHFYRKQYPEAIRAERDALAQITRDRKFDNIRNELQKQLKKFTDASMQ